MFHLPWVLALAPSLSGQRSPRDRGGSEGRDHEGQAYDGHGAHRVAQRSVSSADVVQREFVIIKCLTLPIQRTTPLVNRFFGITDSSKDARGRGPRGHPQRPRQRCGILAA